MRTFTKLPIMLAFKEIMRWRSFVYTHTDAHRRTERERDEGGCQRDFMLFCWCAQTRHTHFILCCERKKKSTPSSSKVHLSSSYGNNTHSTITAPTCTHEQERHPPTCTQRWEKKSQKTNSQPRAFSFFFPLFFFILILSFCSYHCGVGSRWTMTIMKRVSSWGCWCCRSRRRCCCRCRKRSGKEQTQKDKREKKKFFFFWKKKATEVFVCTKK